MPVVPLSLDGIPTELKWEVLTQVPDLLSLRSLVHASPSYHQAYYQKPESILFTVLSRDIEPVLCDAFMANQCSKLRCEGMDRSGRIQAKKEFIEHYKQNHDQPMKLPEKLELQGTVELAYLHIIIHDLVDDFCRSTFEVYTLSYGRDIEYVPPSPTEKRRIFRAFYRFQIYCNLFSMSGVRSPDTKEFTIPDIQEDFDGADKPWMFFSIFQPWEVEELGCIRDFIYKRYTEKFQEVEADVAMMNESDDDGISVWSSEHFNFSSDGINVKDYKEHFMELGLPFLHQVLTTSYEKRKVLIADNLWPNHFFISEPLTEPPYHSLNVTEIYEAHENKGDILFDGDQQGPNQAWVWYVGGKVTPYYYDYSGEVPRCWGYVIWDKSRLENWHAEDAVPKD
ncbi:MAG: hypothetical protein M1834_002263 [Cirrosporium novae-zelandiae]|nr:MAG: hypothetical protein M1834_002263 [Cirrosporium novae-zelandiae]